MMQTKNKALAALGLSAAGFIALQVYQDTFWGGLLSSGCLAALIGGLADWFAVTALFRKPLGIAYRTAIIPRNRERLLGELVQFTSRDLLNSENIMKIVRRYNMTELLIAYLDDAAGTEKVKKLIHQLIERILMTVDRDVVAAKAAEFVQLGLREFKVAPVVTAVFHWSVKNKYDAAVWQFVAQEVICLVGDPKTKTMLTKLIGAVKAEYESDLTRRQMMSFLLDLSPEHLAELLQTEIAEQLEKIAKTDHPLRQRWQLWLQSQVENQENQLNWEVWKEQIVAKVDISRLIAPYLTKLDNGESLAAVDDFIEMKLAQLKSDAQFQAGVDQKIKSYIDLFVHSQHTLLTQIIQDRFNEFSDAALVEFIEDRVADDLQMIRINGSLVGALVGIILYLVTYGAERMW